MASNDLMKGLALELNICFRINNQLPGNDQGCTLGFTAQPTLAAFSEV
ncbi:hypothetical protein [Legionella maioricensis]|uniref:Uncharacterized protein n=1 Tax=Legionella maioricensis TaxID=2896528 RepID=A0A9X2D2L7_9GAMM|nr:hypothetical protein [Legionella maioricensis]MCL9685112.1 hypothetical protein [Legionella maioricensis]MCL9688375.1 hypothetical protein [Legionella maioricensis]